MDSTFRCGDSAALISYLYDECDAEERDAIGVHLAACPRCALEIESLGAARRMLPAWTPPQAGLGFRITDDHRRASVVRPARWWQQPLPAWAQAAAAAAIFAAGLAAGRAGDPAAPAAPAGGAGVAATAVQTAPARPAAAGDAPAVVPVRTAPDTASREDLLRLERDLREQLARIERAQRDSERVVRASSAQDLAGGPGEPVTLERVEALIQDSERRQRGELIQGMAQVVIDVETQRRREMAPMQRTVEVLGREAATNRNSVAALVDAVSLQRGFRPVGGR